MIVLMSVCDDKHQRKITSRVFYEDEFSSSIALDAAAQN